MKALIFIQTNDGKIYYKCDTFWTKSHHIYDAKIYDDNSQSEIDKWITSYEWNIHEQLKRKPDDFDELIQLYDGCRMGYRTLADIFLEAHGFSLRQDVRDQDLGDLIFTHQVQINGLNRPLIFDIRKVLVREDKLNQILK
jgi:hypothetical protein